MRIIALTIAVVMFATGLALAVAPVTAETVMAAQDFGRERADFPLAAFLQLWTVYEERAARLDDTAERACLYTPFLLIAADARDRTAAGGAVAAGDADKVLSDYAGYVIFGVTLVGDRADFAGKYTASLRQGRKYVRPSLVRAPPPPAADGSPPYRVQVYFYFPAQDVATDRSATLTVAAADKRQRFFSVHFGELR
ncbi:MAG TPA: hypothetical protein VN521_05920 [Negativicutes bacterium]|nr:hypothetical protein [Negativicutes bacterium]